MPNKKPKSSLTLVQLYQAIMVKDGIYYGASESRKDGQAAGY
jgi:gamma-glutamyltranspeptidase